MDIHRRPAIGIVLVALLLTGLLGACATPRPGGRLGEANGPAPAVTPAPIGTPTPASSPSNGGPTGGRSVGGASHTATPTATHPRTSAPPASASSDPGDYSVAVANSQGVHECGWIENENGTYKVYAYFGIYYVGPQHPTTVSYRVDVAGASTIVKGSVPPGTVGPFGVPVPNSRGSLGTTTLRLHLNLGFNDDRPGPYSLGGDDEGEITFTMPNGLPPSNGLPAEFPC